MRFSVECAFPQLGKRRPTSRKSALCVDSLTQKRILGPTLTQKRILDSTPHAEAHSGGSEDPRVHLSVRASYRVRFSVRHGLQNALFRRVRFSSPGQTSTHLTQKRILGPTPHAKAHSARRPLTEKRILDSTPHAKAHSARRPLTEKRILDSTPHAKAHSADHDAVEFSLKAAELMDSQWRLIYEKAESSAQYSPPSARLHARLALVCIDGGQRGRQRQTAVIGSAQGGSDLLVFRHENTHLSFRCMPLETPNQLVHEV